MLDGSSQAQAATTAPAPQGDAIRLLGLDFANRPLAQIAATLAARPADAPFAYVVTAQSHQLVRLSREADLRPLYEGAWLRLLGSRVIFKLCRMLALPAPAVIPGCDLSAHLIAREIDRDEHVSLLGLTPDAVATLKARTGLRRVDHHNPPMGFENDPAAFEKALRFIETHPARFTFLALGCPQQCLVADSLRQRTGEGQVKQLMVATRLQRLEFGGRHFDRSGQRSDVQALLLARRAQHRTCVTRSRGDRHRQGIGRLRGIGGISHQNGHARRAKPRVIEERVHAAARQTVAQRFRDRACARSAPPAKASARWKFQPHR